MADLTWAVCSNACYDGWHRVDRILGAADEFLVDFEWFLGGEFAFDRNQYLLIRRAPFLVTIRFSEDIRGEGEDMSGVVFVHSVEVTRERCPALPSLIRWR